MPVSVHDVKQNGSEFIVTGVVESHAASELCSVRADLSAQVVSVSRTSGGGISYEFAISVDDQTWREKEAADAQAMKEKQEADAAAQAQADADAAEKAKADERAESDARIAKIAAEVAKDIRDNG